MRQQKLIIAIVGIMLILFLLPYISAYKLLCLGYEESVPENNPRYTCHHDMCQICVTDNLFPTAPYRCNGLQGCESTGEGGVDQEPPEFEIMSPTEGEVYSSRKVLFEMRSNEPSTFSYIDNIKGRGRWKKIASNIFNYIRERRLGEGHNSLTFKAVDRHGNFMEIVRDFYVDSKKPKISKTYPKKGFSNGDFSVEFKEENPSGLVLHYGNNYAGFREHELDIEEDCYIHKSRYYCDVSVDVFYYDGEIIEYWFELEDIARSVAVSKKVLLEVDMTGPVLINNNVIGGESDSFWSQGKGRYNKYIYFNMIIEEDNFDEVFYSYEDSRGRIREKRICSRLKDGKCVKRVSFRRGNQFLDVQIVDKAGNAVGYGLEFEVG